MQKAHPRSVALPVASVLSAWLLLACNFGVLLFLSSNGDIINPEMPAWPSIAKDFAWLVVLTLAVYSSSSLPRHQLLVITCIPTVLLFACIFSLIGRGEVNFDLGWIKSIKNAVLYMWAPFFLASLVDLQYERLIRHLIAILFVSILFSVLIYFTFEHGYKPADSDLRMFGSTGNPNTASLFSLLLFILVALRFDEMNAMQRWACLVLVFLSVYLSASFLYLSLLMVVMFYFSALSLRDHPSKRLRRYWLHVIVAAVVSWALVTCLVNILSYPGVPFYLRIESALIVSESQSGIMSSDSIAIRMRDLGSFSWGASATDYRQFDSALLTFAYNFGLAGALFSLYPCFLLLFLRKANWHSSNLAVHALIVTAALMFTSSLVHYQVSHFPSNVFLYLLFAFSLKEVLTQAKRSEISARASG